ncbi:hypothetical protein L5014_23750 [Paraburkholderia sp. RG36]|uniref:Apea-like HEPN domain-containing protein n=1 Tax=Paraburkholderia tagetis TaxID=2913261 RepID=A0A9X1RUX9_9BURK|nr:hypothetical protein [Paraburkholderia tagetis]
MKTTYEKVTSSHIELGAVSIFDAVDSPDPEVFHEAFSQLNDAAAGIVGTLIADARFPGNTVVQICREGGASGFYPNFIVMPLLRAATAKGGAREAVSWLEKVFATTSAQGKIFHAIWGAPVDNEIALTEEISIVPIAALPDSAIKTWLTEHRVNSPVSSMLDFISPQSALIVPFYVPRVLHKPGIDPDPSSVEYLRVNDLLNDATLALSAVGPRVTTLAVQWFAFDDPDLELTAFGTGSRGQLMEILPSQPPQYPKLDGVEAADIVRRFLNLPADVKKKIRVTLNRLQQAQKRRTLGDRCVELSTAFETLLGDNKATEMTHKIKVRSVRLLGGSPEIRRHNAAVMGWMYDARSKLVHTGEDVTKGKAINGEVLSPAVLVERATSICTEIVKRLIREGVIPDWADFDILA